MEEEQFIEGKERDISRKGARFRVSKESMFIGQREEPVEGEIENMRK